MVRPAIRAVTRLLVILALPAAILAVPLPASAANHLCETFGNYCVGAANLDPFTPVAERNPGRDIDKNSIGGQVDGLPRYELAFSADPSKCVAAANNLNDVVIHPCNGGSGVVWGQDSSSGHLRFLNQEVFNANGSRVYLCGHNNGTQFLLRPLN